jgi:hypothetical protein
MTPVTPVTTLTKDAERDQLADDDYREIYDEVRGFVAEEQRYQVSLDAFVGLIHSEFSKAAWSKYHRGELDLNRRMRNELRAAVGMAPLPPTVGEAVAGVDPNAEVVQVGEEMVSRLILVATEQPFKLNVNGRVFMVEHEDKAARDGAVTEVTRKRAGISLSPSAFERFNSRRQANGLSWEQLLDMAVAQLEE